MNKMIIVAVCDKKAEAFHPPYTVPTKGIAIRAFGDAVAKSGSDLHEHPEDFSLFQVGSYDPLTGKIRSIEPVSICTGLDFKFDKE